MMLYLHIETSQGRSGQTVMITDQERLILMIKTSHASGRGLACNRKQKRTKKKSGNSTYVNERINPTVSVLQSDDQRERTSREKSENSRKVVSREMVCFKIMKLVYNNYIYTKTF